MSLSDNQSDFINWKNNFKLEALKNDISEETFDLVLANIKFLPNVIKYDRYQPEFYEDTKTYISKRASAKKTSKGVKFYKKNNELLDRIENQFDIAALVILAFLEIRLTIFASISSTLVFIGIELYLINKSYHTIS